MKSRLISSVGKYSLCALLVAIVAGIVFLRLDQRAVSLSTAERSRTAGCIAVRRDFRLRQPGVWITVAAHLERALPDERGQYRHQRFIVRCQSGQTVLIVNNLNIGKRVPLTRARNIVVHGVYVWNRLGGLIHFTHHDPEGGQGGWILYRDRVYALSTAHGPWNGAA